MRALLLIWSRFSNDDTTPAGSVPFPMVGTVAPDVDGVVVAVPEARWVRAGCFDEWLEVNTTTPTPTPTTSSAPSTASSLTRRFEPPGVGAGAGGAPGAARSEIPPPHWGQNCAPVDDVAPQCGHDTSPAETRASVFWLTGASGTGWPHAAQNSAPGIRCAPQLAQTAGVTGCADVGSAPTASPPPAGDRASTPDPAMTRSPAVTEASRLGRASAVVDPRVGTMPKSRPPPR